MAKKTSKAVKRKMSNKIPVTVLTGKCIVVIYYVDFDRFDLTNCFHSAPKGFLGAGKTTLLNHILNDGTHGMKFAVIENEFGEIGVDDKIIPETVDEEVIEVMNGCICCTVRGDLVEALKRLHKRVDKFGTLFVRSLLNGLHTLPESTASYLSFDNFILLRRGHH